MLKINIRETIKFFDERAESQGRATAIAGMIGEDLNAWVFKHYLEARGDEVEIFDGAVTQGTKKGKRLDRWTYVKKKNGVRTLYQCEIKNWSATAIGGRSLSLGANHEEVRKISHYHWERQKREYSDDTVNGINKVFLRMNPDRNENVRQYIKEQKIKKYQQRPLLIYWMPISSDKNGSDPFFTEKVSDLEIKAPTDFKEVDIFSVSLYLRELSKKTKLLPLNMPNVKKRINVLNKIVLY